MISVKGIHRFFKPPQEIQIHKSMTGQHTNFGDVMKIALHILIMVLVAVLVMLLLYPAVHEAAHALAAKICGAEVVNIEVFPMAHTDIVTGNCSRIEIILIMMAGGTLPLLLLFIIPQGLYYFYYIKLILALISGSSAVTSVIYVLQYLKGYDYLYDDAVRLLMYDPDAKFAVLSILVVQFAVSSAYCIITKPINRISDILKNQPLKND